MHSMEKEFLQNLFWDLFCLISLSMTWTRRWNEPSQSLQIMANCGMQLINSRAWLPFRRTDYQPLGRLMAQANKNLIKFRKIKSQILYLIQANPLQ